MEPRFDPDHNLDNFRSIIARMARAKWITGTNIATQTDIWYGLTGLGHQRMQTAVDTLRRAAPGYFDTDPHTVIPGSVPVSHQDALAIPLVIAQLVLELLPPDFSPGEQDTLLAIIADSARRKPLPPASGPRGSS
jgi:hypothetical protein